MNATAQLAVVPTTAPVEAAEVFDTSTAALVLDAGRLGQMMSLAEVMASGRATMPKHLQGNKGDCLAVCMQAMQWKMNPFAVAQKTHLVNGTLGYESQLIVAAINTSGAIRGRLEWEWFGAWERIVGKFKKVESKTKKDDDGNPKTYIVPAWDFDRDEEGLGVIVRGTLRGETQPRELTLLMKQARTRNSTLWTEDPKQQLAYLASKRWGRLYTPEVILGVYSGDEFGDDAPQPKNMGAVEVVDPAVTPSAGLSDEELTLWRDAAMKGKKAGRDHWNKMSPARREAATQQQKDEMWTLAVKADAQRTVDHGVPATAAASTAAAAAPAADPAPSPAPAPADDDFVAAMEAAENAGSAGAAS